MPIIQKIASNLTMIKQAKEAQKPLNEAGLKFRSIKDKGQFKDTLEIVDKNGNEMLLEDNLGWFFRAGRSKAETILDAIQKIKGKTLINGKTAYSISLDGKVQKTII